jgi:hypothetical protein
MNCMKVESYVVQAGTDGAIPLLGGGGGLQVAVSSVGQTQFSETSAIKHHTPGNNTRHSEHGESLKLRKSFPP